MSFFSFQYLGEFLSIGPPVYFVIKSGLNMSDITTQNMICSGQWCDTDSLTAQVYLASKEPDVSVFFLQVSVFEIFKTLKKKNLFLIYAVWVDGLFLFEIGCNFTKDFCFDWNSVFINNSELIKFKKENTLAKVSRHKLLDLQNLQSFC